MNSDARLERAKTYPYWAPSYSYLFVAGTAYEIVDPGDDPVRDATLRGDDGDVSAAQVLRCHGEPGAAGLDHRVPVLAHGSNAAPATLKRKFAGFGPGAVIPVIKAGLADHDVVYATHFSSYGSIPSTIERSPGTTAEIAITFLTPDQLALMHGTEMPAHNYCYGRLNDIDLALDGLGAIASVHCYLTKYGSLGVTGGPLALAAIKARDRRFEQATKVEALTVVRDHLAPGSDVDAFILETIADDELRRKRSAALAQHANPMAHPGFEILEE